MSIIVKCDIKDPIGWMVDYGTQDLIADYSDKELYGRLDNIYHCLVDRILPDNMDGLGGMTTAQMKEEYQRKFPMMIAEALKSIADDIACGELTIKTGFD